MADALVEGGGQLDVITRIIQPAVVYGDVVTDEMSNSAQQSSGFSSQRHGNGTQA